MSLSTARRLGSELVKRVYLLRHAKSDWTSGASSDHDRPLAARGERAASTVGRFLANLRRPPEMVISSTAVRARTTIEIAARDGGLECPIELDDRLYGASPETVLSTLRAADPEIESLLLVGHEPGWSGSVERLVGRCSVRMVTAALARIDLPVESWSDARFDIGTLAWLVTPKLLQRFGG